jgi:hypothetical protein
MSKTTKDRGPPRERPIIFSAPMIRAILDGRKTQTRRILKPEPNSGPNGEMVDLGGAWGVLDGCLSGEWHCPYGQPGDRTYVRETFAFINNSDFGETSYYQYRADTDGKSYPGDWPPETKGDPEKPRWKPAIHMPRAASRITLEIEQIRVERLQEISEEDARAEGFEPRRCGQGIDGPVKSYRTGFVYGWGSIHGTDSWLQNPFVWVLNFRRVKP